jgi:predicted metal-binding membrane protein
VLGRDRRIVIGGLLAVIALSWSYLLTGAGMPMLAPAVWTPAYFALMVVMWWVMMAAMMLPSATPTILLFAALSQKSAERGDPAVSTGIFATAYIIVWGGFSLLATFAQMQLDGLALLSPMMNTASVPLGAALLIAAGAYQMTPLKHACLRHCRAPIDFFARRWRRGANGALLMGLEHGRILPRLLLGDNGFVVLRGRHEPALGRGPGPLRAARKARTGRPANQPLRRGCADSLGRRSAC